MPLPLSQQLAADVASAVNAEFPDLAAERVYSIRAKAADLDTMQVRVASGEETSEQQGRGAWQDTIIVAVGTAQRLTAGADPAEPATIAQIDTLAAQSEALRDHFKAIAGTPLGEFGLVEIQLLPVAEYQDDSGAGIYIATVRLTYRRLHDV